MSGMPQPGRNVEIKAVVADLDAMARRVAELATSGPCSIVQLDTFFHCPHGRLKLRSFADGSGELIRYERPDTAEPCESNYTIYRSCEPKLLHTALAGALGIRGVVRKVRTLYLCGRTRIHLDRVEGLGTFAELEVVLAPGQGHHSGRAIARGLMTALGIAEADLVEAAYIDLLEVCGRNPEDGGDRNGG